MFAVVGFVVEVVFVEKNAIFDFQIPRFWLHHPFDPNMGPSKFPSSCPISMPLSPSNPRCWGSMHIYIGYFHPKYLFDISNINWTYKISSWVVYFYRARYLGVAILYILIFAQISAHEKVSCFGRGMRLEEDKKVSCFFVEGF